MTRAGVATICVLANVLGVFVLFYLTYFVTSAYMLGCSSSLVAMEKRGFVNTEHRTEMLELMRNITDQGAYFWFLGFVGAFLCISLSFLSYKLASRNFQRR